MEKKNNNRIEKYKHLYKLSFSWKLVSFYIIPLHSLFYRKIIVEGKENIPQKGPLIFAPNHQNALMDPLAVLFASHRQIVFLARADVFKNKILAKLFYFLKILPVFRIRDGKENLQNNDETFNIAVRTLEYGQNVGLFPEARHNNKRSLLPLKKGVPRLAFMAEEKNNFNLNLKIIPAGIYYSDYTKLRSVLHIKFGEAISVKDYENAYKDNPQKAMFLLRDEIKRRIKPLIIDIEDNEMYDTCENLRKLHTDKVEKNCCKKNNYIENYNLQKSIIETFQNYYKEYPEKSQSIKDKVTKFENYKSKYKISNKCFGFSKYLWLNTILNSILILLSSPIFIYGLLNNLISYFTPRLITSKIKDKQFHSSIKFVWTVFVIPVVYLIQIIIFAIIVPKVFWILAYTFSLPILGYLAKIILEWANSTLEKWRFMMLRRKKCYLDIKDLHDEILKLI